MVDTAAAYPWSSYRANALGERSPLVTPHPVYLALGRDAPERQAAYQGLVAAQLDPGLLQDVRSYPQTGTSSAMIASGCKSSKHWGLGLDTAGGAGRRTCQPDQIRTLIRWIWISEKGSAPFPRPLSPISAREVRPALVEVQIRFKRLGVAPALVQEL